jgi:SAM-dependent methyltransferase
MLRRQNSLIERGIPMEYSLRQRGRASIDFLVDLRRLSDRLERTSDQYAAEVGLFDADLPESVDALHDRMTPVMEKSRDFRLLRLMREWQLDQHAPIAVDAFDEIRVDIEPALRALRSGPCQITYDQENRAPTYWSGYEFHRSAGGWDGHEYMGFIHGELIHRKMVGETFAGAIYAQRRQVAAMAPVNDPKKILEMGCASGQFTDALAETYPNSEIWACDLSPRQLEQTQRRGNEQSLAWKLLQAPAEETALQDQMFDFVASYAMFHELPTDIARRVLNEAYRLLKPGGCAIIGDVKAYHVQNAFSKWKADYWNQLHGGDPFWRQYATTDLAMLATEAGFIETQWSGVGEDQYPFVLTAVKPGIDREQEIDDDTTGSARLRH